MSNTNANAFSTVFGGKNQLASNDTAVNKVVEVAKAALVAAGENINNTYRVVPIPSAATGSFGAVAVVQTITNAETALTLNFYHLLVIERARSAPLEKSIMNIGGQQIELDVTVGDAYTREYRAVVNAFLHNNSTSKGDYKAAGYQIIYSDTDIESPAKFEPLLQEATRAIGNIVSRNELNAPIFSLKNIAESNGTRRLLTHFAADAAVTEPNGMPIRADLTLLLTVEEARDQKDPTSTLTKTLVASTSAYVDLIYTPQPVGYGSYGQANQQPLFIPRITISNSTVHLPVSSLEFSLLNIGAMVTVLSNRTYGVVWRPNFQDTDSLRDIGAVGYLAKQLTPDGNGGSLDLSEPMALQSFIDSVMNKSAVFSMDIRPGGAGNWVNDIFLRAAVAGDVRAATARQQIITAADNLTDGEFSKHFQAGAEIVSPKIEVFPSGYFTLGNTTQDTSKLDLVAILKLFGAKDMNVVWAYLDSVYNNTLDPSVRIYRRVRLLSTIAKGFTIKAYGSKINFSSQFVSALSKAIAAKGITFLGNSLVSATDQQGYNQSVDQWANYMVDPSSVSNLYSSAAPTSQNPNAFTVGSSASFF